MAVLFFLFFLLFVFINVCVVPVFFPQSVMLVVLVVNSRRAWRGGNGVGAALVRLK